MCSLVVGCAPCRALPLDAPAPVDRASRVRFWTRRLACGAALALLLSTSASAGITTYTDPDVGGFVDDTATDAFLLAIGGAPTRFIDFSTDIWGRPTPNDSAVPGYAFSKIASLRSPEASGGSTANIVLTGGGTGEARVGPSPGFSGTLELLFEADAEVTAVGLGPVSVDTGGTISVFDVDGGFLESVPGASDNTWTFVGFVADGDDLIGRITIETDDPFAIQDLQFVPEPAVAAQGIAALFGLLWLRRAERFGRRRPSAQPGDSASNDTSASPIPLSPATA